jgi:hypothetical protein
MKIIHNFYSEFVDMIVTLASARKCRWKKRVSNLHELMLLKVKILKFISLQVWSIDLESFFFWTAKQGKLYTQLNTLVMRHSSLESWWLVLVENNWGENYSDNNNNKNTIEQQFAAKVSVMLLPSLTPKTSNIAKNGVLICIYVPSRVN